MGTQERQGTWHQLCAGWSQGHGHRWSSQAVRVPLELDHLIENVESLHWATCVLERPGNGEQPRRMPRTQGPRLIDTTSVCAVGDGTSNGVNP